MIEPTGAVLVVTAKSFNPSIFTQLWLSKEDLVADKDFVGASLATEAVAQHDLANMQLLVVPSRLQVTLKPGDEASSEAGKTLVDGIVKKLPHTPFQALGMNLDYLVTFDAQSFAQVNRAMFLAQSGPFVKAFVDGNSLFGGYFSRNINGIRMKVDIKPISTGGEVGVGDKLRCVFNYHVDLKQEDNVSVIHTALAKWSDMTARAVSLLEVAEAFKVED
jgi:hypothetical protein